MTELPQTIKDHLANEMQEVTDTDNKIKSLQKDFASAVEEMVDAAIKFGESLYNALSSCASLIAELISKFVNDCYPKAISIYSSKRVIHLASHAKKKRVRKKNYNRMQKDFYKNIRKVIK